METMTTEDISTKPKYTFVYELVHDDKRIYIGITDNLTRRKSEHDNQSDLIPKPFIMRPLAACVSREDALEIEFALQFITTGPGRCRARSNVGRSDESRVARKARSLTRRALKLDEVKTLFDAGDTYEIISQKRGLSVPTVKRWVDRAIRKKAGP